MYPVVTTVIYATIMHLAATRTHTLPVRAVGILLLAVHLVHDLCAPSRPYPAWMEPLAVLAGAVLVAHSKEALLPKAAGVAIAAAHVRQMVYRDDRYYT